MQGLLDIIPPSCLAISVSCAFLYIVDALQKVQIDKTSSDEIETGTIPVLFKIFMPFTPNAMPIARGESFAEYRKEAAKQLLMAGYDGTVLDSHRFLALRILFTFTGIICGAGFIFAGKPIYGLLLLFVLYIYPQTWLRKTIAKRHLSIQKALPNVLDLLTLSVEAGKDFLTSLRDILSRRKRDPLGEELERTFREIQLGKKRAEALKDLVRRVQQSDLTSVINAIIQADELGVSIAQLLKIQGDQLRIKRFQRAEKMANEAPVKMLFPVAVFIFPSVLIIMGAPLAMQAMKAIFK
ncbi:MAG: type II secretion system F family protein [Victivallales bacterium]|nr:type II secretion system F family protein [Victivallales bacterium]